MLKGLATALLITGCLLGASALPTRAYSSFGSALRRRDSSHRPASNPPLDDLALSSTGMDQSAEASSNVDDFVPRNLLDYGKYAHEFPNFYKYKSENRYRIPIKSTLDNNVQSKDCVDCEPHEQAIVTLGESRSYSVVTGPQTFPPDQPVTEADPLITDRDPITTEWVSAKQEEPTEEISTEQEELIEGEVISVRVSSTIGKSINQEPAALQIEHQPLATAVQRSHFSVEEAIHEPLSTRAAQRTDTSSKYSTSDSTMTAATTTVLPLLIASATSSTIGRYPTPSSDRSDRSLYFRKRIFSESPNSNQNFPVNDAQSSGQPDNPQFVVLSENTSPSVNPLSSPVSYQTSFQSATSESRVSFYREPPNLRHLPDTSLSEILSTTASSLVEPNTQRLKHETRVETVSYHEEAALPQKSEDNSKENDTNPNVNEQKSYQFTNVHDKSFHHVEVTHLNENTRQIPNTPRNNYQKSEKVYGMPEQNYEVDEALSVRSNGRVHGVQSRPAPSPDSNKFGYVVEGRNFKKYRVEERTADGFIVGEYGVVRHDDGSTRGVRYTADSTINPKVIYEALVKFLSL